MHTALVSIIIPTFNRSQLICETLDSILAQTYENWECIIVDDGSTDDTETVVGEYVKKDSRFQFHHRPNNLPKGGNAARNFGFELSNGEYINWFDDDDIMLEDFIKIKVNLFTPVIDLVICSSYYVNSKLEKRKAIVLNEQANLFKDYILWKFQIITASILFSKSFLKDKELFSPTIKRGQETELFSRLFFRLPKASYEIANIPLFLYRQHQVTKTVKNFSYVKSYKESQTNIALANLKKGIEINDEELVLYFYKSLLEFYFRALDNNHFKNSRHILKKLIPQLMIVNRVLTIKLFFIGYFLLITNVRSYSIEKYFRNYKI